MGRERYGLGNVGDDPRERPQSTGVSKHGGKNRSFPTEKLRESAHNAYLSVREDQALLVRPQKIAQIRNVSGYLVQAHGIFRVAEEIPIFTTQGASKTKIDTHSELKRAFGVFHGRDNPHKARLQVKNK